MSVFFRLIRVFSVRSGFSDSSDIARVVNEPSELSHKRQKGCEFELQWMLASIDHIVLNVGRKLREVSTESPDANDQIPVIFGVDLGISQFIRIHHVVLNVRTAV
jgi:hypothetical protein